MSKNSGQQKPRTNTATYGLSDRKRRTVKIMLACNRTNHRSLQTAVEEQQPDIVVLSYSVF